MGNRERTGVWIAGALGDIATTVRVGAAALGRGLAPHTGLVSALPPMDRLDLLPFDALVFGGCDIHPGNPVEAAEAVCRRSRTYSPDLLDAVREDLMASAADYSVDPDMAWDVSRPQPGLPPLEMLVERVRDRLRRFAANHGLGRVVVVNLISVETLPAEIDGHRDLEAFEALLAADRKDQVTPSMVYAYAALREGCPHVNFTPCAGASIPALQGLAEQVGVPHCGNDGKTGETLLKTALAPMFAARHLRVMSWEGFNLLGNEDGRSLADPGRRAGKLRNKGRVLEEVLGYAPHGDVAIHYVPSLGDWKTAWDLVHFAGFLDVPMTLQLTWQGSDSILAAPLVLDLVRFADFAARRGESGLMPHLASFFKDPMGTREHALWSQFQALLRYTERHLRAAG
jgi:myo-inositol-1-phosphate synthase